jgi:hypothetical protein
MIASPGDVAAERSIAQDVIHQWNATHSADRRMVLLPVAWETNAAPAMGERAQEIINGQLLRDADLLVAIFWARIGTPTGDSPSGSVEEVREHIRAGKPAMLYFSTARAKLDSVDRDQYEALGRFKDECRAQGLVEEYESTDEFRQKLTRQLAQTMISRFPASRIEVAGAVEPLGGVPPTADSAAVPRRPITLDEKDLLSQLSGEARELLAAAGNDANGSLLAVETLEGLAVSTDEREFGEPGDPRSEARLKRAIRDLVGLGVLEQTDAKGQVFRVTDEGYRAVDLLSRIT